jgi:hypothetical protein
VELGSNVRKGEHGTKVCVKQLRVRDKGANDESAINGYNGSLAMWAWTRKPKQPRDLWPEPPPCDADAVAAEQAQRAVAWNATTET